MIKLITHTDLDGVGCHVVASYFLKNYIDVSYCDYSNVNKKVLEVLTNHEEYSKIFITDISVDEEVAEKLDKIKYKIILLDHHPTALYLNKYNWAKIELKCECGKTCGTRMLFEYFMPDYFNSSINDFVELVRRYDTWEWKDKYNDNRPKQLNDLLDIIGREEFVEDMIFRTYNNEVLFSNIYYKILEFRQNEINMYVEDKNKNIIVQDILGHKAGVVFAERFISELGNKLSEKHPELDFIVIIDNNKISYRTVKDDVDLSQIAKHFGGGGHPKASGSQIRNDVIYDYIKKLFNK